MKKPTQEFINSLPKIDRYIYHVLPVELYRLKKNYSCDPCSGSYSFQVGNMENTYVYGTPFFEDHEGIPLMVWKDNEPFDNKVYDLPFPESELTYDVITDSLRYIKVMTEFSKGLGYDI